MNLPSKLVSALAALLALSTAQAAAFDYPEDVVLYEGAVAGTAVKVTASARPFSRAAHQTTELRNTGSEAQPNWRPATVDGRPVIGYDQTLPADGVPQLSALTVWFGLRKVSVPALHLHHVFLPHLRPASIAKGHAHTLVAFSADAGAVAVSLGVGDGGASGTYDLLIMADGTISTEPVRRPEP